MNKIWIIEKNIGDEVDYFLAAEDEKKGLQQALSEISKEFTDNTFLWDMTDTIIAARAHNIYTRMQLDNLDQLREAINLYNLYMSSYSDPIHKWTVFCTNVQEPESIQQLDRSFFFPNENDDEEPSKEEIKEDLKTAIISNGATCRKCTAFNEYAVPDHISTCTYLCGQCKVFIKVFDQSN